MHRLNKAFSIGLSPLALDEWIETDENLQDYLAEKERLYAAFPRKVFAEEQDTRESQREIRDALTTHLLCHFPQHYEHKGNTILAAGSRPVDLKSEDPPLLQAARLI